MRRNTANFLTAFQVSIVVGLVLGVCSVCWLSVLRFRSNIRQTSSGWLTHFLPPHHPFEPIQSLCRWRQYVPPKRRNIWPLHSTETRPSRDHLPLFRCTTVGCNESAQSSADSLNKWQLRISSSIMFCIVLPTPDIFIICVAVRALPSPPLGRSPLQAVSVSKCSKLFGFRHVARVPPSVWPRGAAPTEGPCISHLAAHASYCIAVQEYT
jgi:hypothetical protein